MGEPKTQIAGGRDDAIGDRQDIAQSCQAKPDKQNTAPSLGISRSNIGFKLLKQAGWEEGKGLGACKQGVAEPVAAWHQAGRKGIGATGNTGEIKRMRDPQEQGIGGNGKQQPQKKSKADKQADKRIEKNRQRQQALKDQALDRRMRWLFDESDTSVQHNPLVQRNSRLSASNPLLDDD